MQSRHPFLGNLITGLDSARGTCETRLISGTICADCNSESNPVHVALLEGVTQHIEYLAIGRIAGNVHGQLVELGAVHVRLEQLGEPIAIGLAAQQPGHEVHADHDAVEGVAFEVRLEALVAGED